MKGFTFLEVLFSVSIAAMSFLAIFALASQNIEAAQLTQMRFVAANLAQEGIEIIANMRSNNWLQFPDNLYTDNSLCKWRGENDCLTFVIDCIAGSPNCLVQGTYIANYNSAVLSTVIADPSLVIDANGFYCHAALGCAGTTSPYSRIIKIEDVPGAPGDHEMKALSTVSWVFKGVSRNVEVEARFYNWK